jgi:hypothetical protein
VVMVVSGIGQGSKLGQTSTAAMSMMRSFNVQSGSVAAHRSSRRSLVWLDNSWMFNPISQPAATSQLW